MFRRGHPSVLLVSSPQNCHISVRRDDERRKEMGPEDPTKTRPNSLFAWALSGREKGKRYDRGPIIFFYECRLCIGQLRHSHPERLSEPAPLSPTFSRFPKTVPSLPHHQRFWSLLKATAQKTKGPFLLGSPCMFSRRRRAP